MKEEFLEALIKAGRIRQKFYIELHKLPENTNIKPLAGNCFTVNRSALMDGDILAPEYYLFQIQYKAVARAIADCSLEKVWDTLDKILKEKKVTMRNPIVYYIKLHPEVVINIKNLIDEFK